MPTLKEKTMLVQLSISQWYNRTADNSVSVEVCQSKKASSGVGRYIKKLLPDEAFNSINRCIRQIRNDHAKLTLPWQDGNIRILPAVLFLDYKKLISEGERALEEALWDFHKNFDLWKNGAKKELGSLFNEQDYPNPDDIIKNFIVKTHFLPFPDTTDFRVDINEAAMAQLREETNEFIHGLVVASTLNLFNSLLLIVLKAKLAVDGYVEGRTFHSNTLLAPLVEANRVTKMNVTGAPYVNEFAHEVQETFARVDPQQLRENHHLLMQRQKDISALYSRWELFCETGSKAN